MFYYPLFPKNAILGLFLMEQDVHSNYRFAKFATVSFKSKLLLTVILAPSKLHSEQKTCGQKITVLITPSPWFT